MDKPPLLVQGMHGLGDNLHQRAILRVLMERYKVTLESSWVSVYHDMVPQGLRILRKPVALRAQLKNAVREADKFVRPEPQHHDRASIRISYGTPAIRAARSHSVMEAMFASAGVADRYGEADWRLPVPAEWHDHLTLKSIEQAAAVAGKPICVYRPLVARTEWMGWRVRNANADDYADLFALIRDRFFVVSVADLEPNREWIVGPRLRPDVTLHKGELAFDQLAALFKMAALAYTGSGFAAILAPAVGTPCISVQGGYENSEWLGDGAKFAPWLGIDTVAPCFCGNSSCMSACPKRIDLPPAKDRISALIERLTGAPPIQLRGRSEIFEPVQQEPPAPRAYRRAFAHNPHPLAPGIGSRFRTFRGGGVKA